MPRPLNERGFEVRGEYPPYNISYEINKEGVEVVYIGKGESLLGDSITVHVMDGQVRLVYAKTNQVDINQDVKIDELDKGLEDKVFGGDSSEEGLLSENFPTDIKLPKETREINYSQGLELYHRVVKLLDVEKRLKEYVPRFSSETELTLANILGLDDINDVGETKKEGGEQDAS